MGKSRKTNTAEQLTPEAVQHIEQVVQETYQSEAVVSDVPPLGGVGDDNSVYSEPTDANPATPEPSGEAVNSEPAATGAALPPELRAKLDSLTPEQLALLVSHFSNKPQRAVRAKCEVQNGVRKPRAGGKCARVWQDCDNIVANGGVPTNEMVKALAAARGDNENNAQIELSGWRKFHGITGGARAHAASMLEKRIVDNPQ